MSGNPKCRQIRRRLPQFVRAEMEPADYRVWADHLSVCPSCRQEEAQERQLQTLCKAVLLPPLPESPTLREKVHTTLSQRIQWHYRQRLFAWSATFTLVALFLGGALKVWRFPLEDSGLTQRQVYQAQRELFWTHLPQPAASQEQLENTPYTMFLDYNLSGNQCRHYQEAVNHLQRRLRHQPHRPQDWVMLGTLQVGLNQAQSGKQSLQQALDLNPALSGVYQQISEIYRREGKFAEALQAADRAVARNPKTALPYCQRAAVRAGLHDFAGALRDLQQAQVYDPEAPEVYFGKGLVYLEEGKHPEAARSFQKAIDLDPSYHRARILLGMVCCLQGYLDLAIAAANQVLEKEPNYPLAYFLLGIVYEDQGNFEVAISAYRKALEINPEQDYAAYRLGRQYAILGCPQVAQEVFSSLVEKAPGAYMLHLQLGLAYQQLRRFPEAIQELQTACEQEPRIAYAPFSLASAFYAAGQPEQALETLLKTSQTFSGESELWELLYKFLREPPTSPGLAYEKARALLACQRGPRSQRFLGTVARAAQEQGVLEQVRPQLEQAYRSLERGDVIQAEQQGAALCSRFNLGLSITLGPANQASGLEHVDLPERDGGTRAVTDLGGRSGRWTQTGKGQNRIYFDVAEDGPPWGEAWVVVEYWDTLDNRFRIEYDSMGTDKFKPTENVCKGDTQTWQRYIFWLPDAGFQGRQHEGADFRLFSRGWRDTAVHSVRVLKGFASAAQGEQKGNRQT